MVLKNISVFLTLLALVMIDEPFALEYNPELELINFILNSTNIMQRNHKESMTCFEYYLPLINECIQEYADNNKLCSTNAEKARNDTEAATAANQKEIAKKSDAACEAVLQCKNAASATNIYQCYVDEGSTGAKSLQVISNEATVQLADLNETLRRIESEKQMCFTHNKIQYEKDSEALYGQLNDCIYGIATMPTITN